MANNGEHWVTINGAHVLIDAKGNIQGNLKGKIKKRDKAKEELFDRAMKQSDKGVALNNFAKSLDTSKMSKREIGELQRAYLFNYYKVYGR